MWKDMTRPSYQNDIFVLDRTEKFSVIRKITLYEAGLNVLCTAEAMEKARLTLLYTALWKNGTITEVMSKETRKRHHQCPDKPARPVSFFESLAHDDDVSAHLSGDIDRSLPHHHLISTEKRKRIKNMVRKNALEFTIHGIANAESYAIDLFWYVYNCITWKNPS